MGEVIAFRNDRQVAIFEAAVKPALAKGHWAGARPYGHSKDWVDAQAKVDDKRLGRTFEPPKADYDLLNKEFVEEAAEKAIRRVKKDTGQTISLRDLRKELTDMMFIMRTPVGAPLATSNNGLMGKPGRPSKSALEALRKPAASPKRRARKVA